VMPRKRRFKYTAFSTPECHGQRMTFQNRRNAVLVSNRTIYEALRKKKRLWTHDLAQRYNCHPRTIKRWQKLGKLPPPTRMPNGRLANTEDEIEGHERGLVAGEAA